MTATQTEHDWNRVSTTELLRAALEVPFVRRFSPEHGLQGRLEGAVPDGLGPATGLPVVSLDEPNRKPRPEPSSDLDALVFDLQDIGCRFYTYASTLGLAEEAAAERGKKVVVLDPVNPITGRYEERPLLGAGPPFVGFSEVPLRHRLMEGKLARLDQVEKGLPLRLTVVRCENWQRRQ